MGRLLNKLGQPSEDWPQALRALQYCSATAKRVLHASDSGSALRDREVPFHLPLVFLVMFVGALLASPAPVVLDQSGIRQRYWWRRSKYIPWNEVVEAVHERTDRTVVRGKWGTCISFSPYLIGQDRFEQEILTHSDLNGIPEYI